jgi:beta-mannosidase
LVVAELGGHRGLWFFADFRDSLLQAAQLDAEAVAVDDGVEVRVTAHNLVRELTVLADVAAADAEADRALVTLLPGEQTTFHIRTSERSDPDRFLSPLVLRSANALVCNRKVHA